MKQALAPALVVVALGLTAACDQPEVNDEPEYQSTTVQTPEVVMINPPWFNQTIAVVPFVNKTLADYKALGDIAPDVLAELVLEGGWRLVESNRAQLDAVAEELNFGQTEMVDEATAAKIGNMLGAKFVMIGAVTNFRITKAAAKKGVDVLGIVSVGGKESVLTFDVQVSGRIVNVETREVIAAGTEAVKQKYQAGGSKTRVLFVKVEDGETIEIDQDSMGKVLHLAFAKMVNKIHAQANRRAGMMASQPPPPPPPGGGGQPYPGGQ
jgi:curli biogenesis system outer membrane secretion channel CsgG